MVLIVFALSKYYTSGNAFLPQLARMQLHLALFNDDINVDLIHQLILLMLDGSTSSMSSHKINIFELHFEPVLMNFVLSVLIINQNKFFLFLHL